MSKKQDYIEARTEKSAKYIVENRCTIRQAEEALGIPRTVIHNDLCRHLPSIDSGLYDEVREILNWNKAERHIRGGIATAKSFAAGKKREKHHSKFSSVS